MTLFNPAVTYRITAEARNRDFRSVAAAALRAVLTAVAAVLYGLGWTVAKTLAVAWFTAAWCGTAVKVGWQEARAADRT